MASGKSNEKKESKKSLRGAIIEISSKTNPGPQKCGNCGKLHLNVGLAMKCEGRHMQKTLKGGINMDKYEEWRKAVMKKLRDIDRYKAWAFQPRGMATTDVRIYAGPKGDFVCVPGRTPDWNIIKSDLEALLKLGLKVTITLGKHGIPVPEWFVDWCKKNGVAIRYED